MSRYVTVIMTREVEEYKIKIVYVGSYPGDKFLHTSAVTIVNKRDHTLHNVIEEEIKSPAF